MIFITLFTGFHISNNNSNNSNETDVNIRSVSIQSFLLKSYDDYNDLISDSELIVKGIVTVANMESYIESSFLYNFLEFEINEVLKGSLNTKNTKINTNKIKISIESGEIERYKFFEYEEDMFKEKLTQDEFKKAKEEAYKDRTEKIEYIYDNMKHPKVGEEFIFFLQQIPNSDTYAITGSSAYGMIKYDANKDIYYRDKITTNNVVTNEVKSSIITLDRINEKIKTIPDNSKTIKSENQRKLDNINKPVDKTPIAPIKIDPEILKSKPELNSK